MTKRNPSKSNELSSPDGQKEGSGLAISDDHGSFDATCESPDTGDYVWGWPSLSEPFELSDLRRGVREGKRILGAFIVDRSHDGRSAFVVYFRSDWVKSRRFQILRTFRGKADREYKHLNDLYLTIRELGYDGRVSIYRAGDKDLALYAGTLPVDLERPTEP